MSVVRVTSVDVARAAGVSQATVSHVLNPNAKQNVSERTREAVLRAAESLGYRPHAGARSLRLGRSDTVLMPLPAGMVARVVDVVVDICGAELARQGLTLVTDRTAHVDDAHREQAWARLDPAAIIDLGLPRKDPVIASLRGAGITIVSADLPSTPHALTGLDEVSDRARREQVRHLLARGYRSIVLALPLDQDISDWPRRLRAVTRMVKAAGATFEVRQVDVTRESLHAEMSGWKGTFDAVCASNDQQAIGLLSTCRQLRIRVPDDLAIMGLDDDPLSAVIGLSTIRFDLETVGRSLAATTLALVRGEVSGLRVTPPAMAVEARETT